MRFPKFFSPFLIASLIFAPGGAFAAKAAISFDFGTGPGKVTAADSGFTEGETYTFTVTGDYVGENDLNVTLSLTDGVTTTDLTTTVDRNDYPGVLTGASARLREGWAISFHNYSIAIP